MGTETVELVVENESVFIRISKIIEWRNCNGCIRVNRCKVEQFQAELLAAKEWSNRCLSRQSEECSDRYKEKKEESR